MRKTRLRLATEASVFSSGKHRKVILEFDPKSPELISMRLSGMRSRYHVALDRIFVRVVEWTVTNDRLNKKKRKKELV